jgi:hypothetical protein
MIEDGELRAAAIALDDKLAQWVDTHWTMLYPFQSQWLAVHRALYGHDRHPILSPCTNGNHDDPH